MASYRVEILPQALAEPHEAYTYLLPRNRQAAVDFRRRFDEAIHDLMETAHTWTSDDADLRDYFMKQFPYTLVFQVFDDLVVVVACAHQRREPGYWRDGRI